MPNRLRDGEPCGFGDEAWGGASSMARWTPVSAGVERVAIGLRDGCRGRGGVVTHDADRRQLDLRVGLE